ncbi:hypothetical protein [Streptomyces sp. 5-6(2022)]|uniref:hypothetical protein n=1 Tax=Streptomyces sp. 5-6(2022) TaxID=2936510 RepID=UPI0023B8AA79|nr:hypothetical protein [Streptomyces sp. 5-6(2022)]
MPAPDLAALEAAGRALLPGLPADTVTVWTTRPAAALLFVSLNPVEHQRRQRAHAKPLTNRNALSLLMGLPHARVPLGSLTDREETLLPFVPHGAATVDFGHITRLAVKPLTVHLAVVPPQAPRRAINRASQYGPFCARAMLLTRPSRDELLLYEADWWGIGVAVATGGQPVVLRRPKPWVPKRHTPAHWAFTERIYQQYLSAQTSPALDAA